MGRLFGTNGVRGIIGKDMNCELALRLGKACGTYLQTRRIWSRRELRRREQLRIIIGTDARTSKDMIKSAFISGILSTGCDVYDAGIIPSPGLQYATKHFGMDMGVIITASHNPPEFNGIKCIDKDGTELSSEQENEIEEIYFSGEFHIAEWKNAGQVYQKPEAIRVYIDAVVSKVDAEAIRKKHPKVIVDCSNGAGSLTAPYILREIGCEVLTINCQLDGMFPGHPSEPVEENVKDLMNAVRSTKADFGVVNDGDADRTIFIDENGRYITPDKELTLFAELAAKSASEMRKGKKIYVVAPVAVSMSTEEAISPYGGQMVYTAIGSPKVARKMIELNAVFGGEANGGLIFPEIQYCRDGGMAAAKMAEMLAKTDKKLSELLDELPRWYMVQSKTECPDELKSAVLEKYERIVEGLKPVSIDKQDGIKSYFKDGWVLARPSGTEPIFRIYAESRDKTVAEKMLSDHIEIIQKVVREEIK